ncbi:hypothetical protein DPM19_11085 [Actinomadura craniellae]|uniref:Uncharacterized protein n=1 Tax=Actinomadura craniellae TaxID=2231787 RepID=A0A365H888_9ACTN|nr:hypothetical protein [Actinomadura craniellae]RAY15249.1 hypothetical protein DPM19_11085 [Actinomadura craniellae]
MSGSEKDVDRALAEATRWMDEISEVVSVGQGESGGEPTVDVWVTGTAGAVRLPERLHGVAVRVRESGGPVDAYSEEDRPPP